MPIDYFSINGIFHTYTYASFNSLKEATKALTEEEVLRLLNKSVKEYAKAKAYGARLPRPR